MAVKVREWKGAFWIFVAYQGRRKAKRVGIGKTGQRAAEAAAEQIQAKLVLQGVAALDALAPPPQAAPVPTFGAYATDWLAMRGVHRWKPATRELYEDQVRCRLLPAFGPLPLSAITGATVEAFVAGAIRGGNRNRPGQGVSPRTLRINLGLLRAILRSAVRAGWLKENPAADFTDLLPTKARQGEREVEVFTRDELAALLATLEQDWPAWAPFTLVLARAGLRLGEALALQWADVDVAHRTLRVRRTWRRAEMSTPKSGKARTVDMSAQLTAGLQGWHSLQAAEAVVQGRELSAWVFPDATGRRPAAPETFRSHVWRPALARAGLRYRPPHTLRHTFASQLLQAGAPVPYVAEQLGHWSPVMTLKAYSHVIPKANAGLVDRLDDATTRNLRATAPHASEPITSLRVELR